MMTECKDVKDIVTPVRVEPDKLESPSETALSMFDSVECNATREIVNTTFDLDHEPDADHKIVRHKSKRIKSRSGKLQRKIIKVVQSRMKPEKKPMADMNVNDYQDSCSDHSNSNESFCQAEENIFVNKKKGRCRLLESDDELEDMENISEENLKASLDDSVIETSLETLAQKSAENEQIEFLEESSELVEKNAEDYTKTVDDTIQGEDTGGRKHLITAKEAAENRLKIKSESNRMIRTKNASLPYHKPTQMTLKDVINASKLKNGMSFCNLKQTLVDIPKSVNDQTVNNLEDCELHRVNPMTNHCSKEEYKKTIDMDGSDLNVSESKTDSELRSLKNTVDETENKIKELVNQTVESQNIILESNIKEAKLQNIIAEVENNDSELEKSFAESESSLTELDNMVARYEKIAAESENILITSEKISTQLENVAPVVPETWAEESNIDENIEIIREHNVDIQKLDTENETNSIFTEPEAGTILQTITLDGLSENIIDLTSDIVIEVPRKLTGVELLRENFIKHASLKTSAEKQRETEHRLKNRVFDLKQSLGEIIIKQKIEQWISRENEADSKTLNNSNSDEKCKEAEMSDEDFVPELKTDDDSEIDTDSSLSTSEDESSEEINEKQPDKTKRKRKRLVDKGDDSSEDESRINEKQNNNETFLVEEIAKIDSNKNASDVVLNNDILRSPHNNTYDFQLQVDTQSDDVFSPNKTFVESQNTEGHGSEISENISSKDQNSENISQVQDLPSESLLIVEETQSHNKTITDDSELMDLCTGKFVDGLVLSNSLAKSPLEISDPNDLSLTSFTTQNNEYDIHRKPYTEQTLDEINKEDTKLIMELSIFDNKKVEDDTLRNVSSGVRNQKGKLVIMSSEEESYENVDDDDSPTKRPKKTKKLLKKRDRTCIRRQALNISDDDSSSSDEGDFDNNSASDADIADREDVAVEYDSEENEITQMPEPKITSANEFFENEAQLTSEDEWKGSGDEDEADLDRLEREEGDDDKFNERKVKKQLERIHMRQILDEDKREVRLLQEILLEDGELTGRSRERKFKWKDFDWSQSDPNTAPDLEGSQNLEDLECEAMWRKQRHEREAYLREMKRKEKATNGNIEDDLDRHVTHVATRTAEEISSKEGNVVRVGVPGPRVDSLLEIKRTATSFVRAAASFSRLSALLESTGCSNDEILSTKVDVTSKGLVFEKCTTKEVDIMTKKRKAEEASTPTSKKPCSLSALPKIRKGLLDVIDL